MSHPEDSDLLRRAAAAMRTERTGHNAGSGFTRARLLNDVRAGRKKRNRWWRIGFPVGIILAGTTAWASASGRWPEMLVNISTILNMPLTDNGASERSLATAKSTNAARSRPTDGSLQVSEAASDELAVAPAATIAEAAAVLPEPAPTGREAAIAAVDEEGARPATRVDPAKHRSPRTTMRAAAPSDATGAGATIAEPPAPPPPELEAEIRAFRRADDLYRRSGDLQGAVGAYRQYVRDYPTGRFVPEAKYNTALSLLKLGRAAEARPLLAPFAEGAYGAYRQEAAQKLLEALQ
jgi:TolA-binding protein